MWESSSKLLSKQVRTVGVQECYTTSLRIGTNDMLGAGNPGKKILNQESPLSWHLPQRESHPFWCYSYECRDHEESWA